MGDEVESNRILYFSPTCVCVLSHIRLFETPGTVARQAPLSMGISRQEYWSGFAIVYSRGSSRPRGQTCIFCTGRRILYPQGSWGASKCCLLAAFMFCPSWVLGLSCWGNYSWEASKCYLLVAFMFCPSWVLGLFCWGTLGVGEGAPSSRCPWGQRLVMSAKYI